MFGRSWLFGAVIVGTAALPYLMSSSSGLRDWARKLAPAAGEESPTVDPLVDAAPAVAGAVSAAPKARAPRPEDVPVHRLEDAL